MSDPIAVALWVGNSASKDALKECLRATYTEDGDYVGSEFERAFDIRHPETGMREVTYHVPPGKNVEDLLKGNSYCDQLIPQFCKLAPRGFSLGVNSVVLFYGCEFEGDKQIFRNSKVFLRFVGNAMCSP